MPIFVVEGQTAPIDYQILADGSVYDLSGCTVTTVARKIDGTVIALTGSTSVTDAANGKVRFSPDATDLLQSYTALRIRFRVVRADTKIEFFPTAEPESWVIQK